MPSFKLDGKTIPFEPGDTIINAARKAGVEIPHYCWHPGLSAPANCRMCLVEIKPAANQRPITLDVLTLDPKTGEYKYVPKPKLQPACQYPAVDGQEVLGDASPHVQEARKGVQEFLLLNHPVDCPICDQAGECKLQDYWLEHQKTQKRMRDEPVHKPKAIVFGPSIVYDAERCVMCTRCIRFMAEVAKDPVLDMRERGNLNEITVAPGRQLDGNYTLMTEHVCPVGALTATDFRFKARVWFLRSVKSVCQGCATGCNAWLDYDPRSNKVYRYRPRENPEVNKFWMCDPGMLSYKAAHELRVTAPLVKRKKTTIAKAFEALKSAFDGVPKEAIAVVFSAQHSMEDNWAMKELAVKLLGTRMLYRSGYLDGIADDVLINSDKNSNTAGVKQLAPSAKPFADLLRDIESGAVTHVIALGGATPGDWEADRRTLDRLKALVTIAAHEGPFVGAATVVLPATSWAEAGGTYTNVKGMRQISDKAIEPVGKSEPAWKHLADVGKALGVDAQWTKLKDIRARLLAVEMPSQPDVSQASGTGSTAQAE
jgi:NADH-quinone oxidoreductase subunit G